MVVNTVVKIPTKSDHEGKYQVAFKSRSYANEGDLV